MEHFTSRVQFLKRGTLDLAIYLLRNQPQIMFLLRLARPAQHTQYLN